MRSKQVKWIETILHPYGLTISKNKTHYGIFLNGKRVGTMSSSPRGPYSAQKTVKQLINAGILPPEAMRKDRP